MHVSPVVQVTPAHGSLVGTQPAWQVVLPEHIDMVRQGSGLQMPARHTCPDGHGTAGPQELVPTGPSEVEPPEPPLPEPPLPPAPGPSTDASLPG
jgi:hypothetical protein